MRNSDSRYKSALKYILSRELFGMKLGLENISRFLDYLGNPEKKFPSVHIAGTNGKGSTAAYLDSILRQAGYKTGIFTSPHLVDFRERIKVSGGQIGKQYITNFIEKHKKTISGYKITFFEVCTALAFEYFADKKVDIAIIETGLGGRLDATNTMIPLLSIITDISYDHTHILGNTLRKIAFEKAGIIKKDVPILTGILLPPAMHEIDRVCRQRKSPLYRLLAKDFSELNKSFNFHFHHGNLDLRKLESSLPGKHQILNAVLSIRVLQLLKASGFAVSSCHIRAGLKKTVWPGRFQTLKQKGKPTVILDVGHNPAGFKAMINCFKTLYPNRKADIVVGMVSFKDLKKSLAYLPHIARKVTVAPLKTHRSAKPIDMARILRSKKVPVTISSSITSAARKMINSAKTDDIIIVCGSHYGVGEFIAHQEEIYAGKKGN